MIKDEKAKSASGDAAPKTASAFRLLTSVGQSMSMGQADLAHQGVMNPSYADTCGAAAYHLADFQFHDDAEKHDARNRLGEPTTTLANGRGAVRPPPPVGGLHGHRSYSNNLERDSGGLPSQQVRPNAPTQQHPAAPRHYSHRPLLPVPQQPPARQLQVAAAAGAGNAPNASAAAPEAAVLADAATPTKGMKMRIATRARMAKNNPNATEGEKKKAKKILISAVSDEGIAYGMAKTFRDLPSSQELYDEIADLTEED